jgi:hypothetical protein
VDGPYKWRYSDASGASGPLFCGNNKSTSSGREGGGGGDGGGGVGDGRKEAKGVASSRVAAKAHENDARCGEDWASQLAPRTAETQLGVYPIDLAAQAPAEDEDGVMTTTAEAEGKEEEGKKEEEEDSRKHRRSDLMDDDDFFEAMEDVHAWLGRILDH